VKKQLTFCPVTQEGDDDCRRLPASRKCSSSAGDTSAERRRGLHWPSAAPQIGRRPLSGALVLALVINLTVDSDLIAR